MLGLIVGESNLPQFLIAKLIKSKKDFIILDLTKDNIYKKYNMNFIKFILFNFAFSKSVFIPQPKKTARLSVKPSIKYIKSNYIFL